MMIVWLMGENMPDYDNLEDAQSPLVAAESTTIMN